jgi:hypothetical protein
MCELIRAFTYASILTKFDDYRDKNVDTSRVITMFFLLLAPVT